MVTVEPVKLTINISHPKPSYKKNAKTNYFLQNKASLSGNEWNHPMWLSLSCSSDPMAMPASLWVLHGSMWTQGWAGSPISLCWQSWHMSMAWDADGAGGGIQTLGMAAPQLHICRLHGRAAGSFPHTVTTLEHLTASSCSFSSQSLFSHATEANNGKDCERGCEARRWVSRNQLRRGLLREACQVWVLLSLPPHHCI